MSHRSGSGEILIGKTLPYFLLGMAGLLLTASAGRFLFHVPLRGSTVILAAVSALYLLVALGFGLLISSATRNQFVAGQITLIATFLPAVFLSGFIFDLTSVPRAVQFVSYLLPARYYVSFLQTIFLAGNVWSVIHPGRCRHDGDVPYPFCAHFAQDQKEAELNDGIAAKDSGADPKRASGHFEGPQEPIYRTRPPHTSGPDFRLRGHIRSEPGSLRGLRPGPQRSFAAVSGRHGRLRHLQARGQPAGPKGDRSR